MRRVAIPLLAALFLVSCSSGPDRSAVVAAIGDDALVPLIEEATGRIAELDEAIAAFCNEPTQESLSAAQDAWAKAKDAWESSEIAVYFGPATTLQTEWRVDFEPVSSAGIDELLASDTVIDFDYVDTRLASSRRGLGAVEYAIFRPLEEAEEERLCQLAASASAVAAAASQESYLAWIDGSDAFLPIFTGTMTSNDALTDVVGAQYETLKHQTLSELGRALGVTAAEPDPGALVEGPAERGVIRLLAQLAGIEATLTAGGETSLLELISSRSEDVAVEIGSSLEDAVASLEAIEGSLAAAVENDPQTMNEVLDRLSRLRDLIEVDVVSLLDLTLGISDSDSDTG